MKVVFAIPTYDGSVESRCMMSLITALHVLWHKGIQTEVFIMANCAYLPMARNTLVSMFMGTDATDLFFLDADVAFQPEGVIRLLEIEEFLVAGIYPLKRDKMSFPVQIKRKDGVPVGKALSGKDEYLIEADFLPTGFMRIKRGVIEKMISAYPELEYKGSYVEVSETGRRDGYNLFGMGVEGNKMFTTEDYAFCQRWRDIGGKLWVYPNLEFEHVGKKSFKGNYQEHLLKGD